MSDLTLPGPITAYFDADKRDAEAVALCFIEQAVVKDEGRTHRGTAAITAWKTESARKYSYTSEPRALKRQDDRYVVTTRVSGSFPGSPVDLEFSFRLERGKIASLEITP
jgi:hypothetical protein